MNPSVRSPLSFVRGLGALMVPLAVAAALLSPAGRIQAQCPAPGQQSSLTQLTNSSQLTALATALQQRQTALQTALQRVTARLTTLQQQTTTSTDLTAQITALQQRQTTLQTALQQTTALLTTVQQLLSGQQPAGVSAQTSVRSLLRGR